MRSVARTVARSGLARAGVVLGVVLAAAVAPLRAQRPAAPAPRTLSLAEAVELAEAASEEVGIARAGLGRARGERRRARSAAYPQLAGTASYTRTLQSQFSVLRSEPPDTGAPRPTRCNRFTPRPAEPIEARLDSLERAVECATAADPFAAFADLPFGRENEYRLGLALSQTLYSGGRLGAQRRAAEAGVQGAEITLASTTARVLLDVAVAYYDAALAERLAAIAEATLRQADTTLSQVRLARRVGARAEFDLLRAAVARGNQRPLVIRRRAERDLAGLRLKQLLNLPLEQRLVLTTPLTDSTGVPAARVAAVVAAAAPADTIAAARAPVRSAEAAVRAREALLRAAESQRLPQLALTSQYAQLAYPSGAFPGTDDFVSDWSVSLGVQVPILTGGRLRAEEEIARAELEDARLRLGEVRELARFDARRAATELEAAAAELEASGGTAGQAVRAYEIAELRYREGLSTQTELTDARLQLEQAEANRARAARDFQIARLRHALLPALPLRDAASPVSPAAGSSVGAPIPVNPAPLPAPVPAAPAGPSQTFQAGVVAR